jgi:hypothetical protein
MGNFKLDGRTIGIGILVILAALVFLPRLLNNNNDTTPTEPDINIPQDNRQDTNFPAGSLDIELGSPVVAASVDSDGCPVDVTNQFENSEDVFIVAPSSYIPDGTSVFVRLYHENTAVEDSREIIADRDYQNTCINFVFEPTGAPFDTGDYMAEFYVNGNLAESIEFRIQ